MPVHQMRVPPDPALVSHSVLIQGFEKFGYKKVSGLVFVTFFDCLHDMRDPVRAARHVLETLATDGTWMIVEPFANTG